jgi:hypothetical protein
MPQEEEVYTEQDITSAYFLGISANQSDANYFERAQDFQNVIKVFRIRYLSLKPQLRKDSKGDQYLVYIKQSKENFGINKDGVEACVRFLEPRLGKHIVLTSWDEERMMNVLLYDMRAWLDMMNLNYEAYDMSAAMLIELTTEVNVLLETAYRRGVGDQEREKMRPITKEIMRLFGLEKKDDRQASLNELEQLMNKNKKEAGY